MARPGKYANVRKGYAEDLADGNYYSSGWERDTARFLNFLQQRGIIEGWVYEPQEFSFQGLGYKRGPFTYLPDFIVRYCNKIRKRELDLVSAIFDEVHPGRNVFWEVKGQETGKDRNKWRRFRKHVGYPLEIVKRDKMLKMQELQAFVPEWESKVW